MRFSARRLGASSILTGILLAGGFVTPAGAATYSTTVTQSAPTPLRAGSTQVVTATVTVDGAPAPDGTLVSFWVTRDPGEFVVGQNDVLTSAGIGNAAAHGSNGYWLADAAGNVFAYGSAPALGGLPSVYGILDWVVGIAPTPTGNGYWLATLDGKVYPFGDAPEGVVDYGPFDDDWAVGLVPAADGVRYRLVTARGRTLPSSAALNNTTTTGPLFDDAPVIGAVANGTGDGYWVFNGNGRVAAFGLNTGFYGDLRGTKLNRTITAMAPAPFGTGYWLLDEDGMVFAFGTAEFLGSGNNGDPIA